MAVVAFSALSPEILAVAPSCPLLTITRELRNAARDFCLKSNAYRHRIDNEPVSSGEPNVQILTPDDTILIRPISVSVNGLLITPVTDALLDVDDPSWRTASGPPKHYLREWDVLDELRLYPIPDADYTTVGMRGIVAVQPTRAATTIEEAFLDRYQEAIIHGALSKLLLVPSASWYNPTQGIYHKGQFLDAIDAARTFGNSEDLPVHRVMEYGGI